MMHLKPARGCMGRGRLQETNERRLSALREIVIVRDRAL